MPRVLHWLRGFKKRPEFLVDPFFGGGSVPLTALVEGLVERIVVSEIDEDVAAVWICAFGEDNAQLCRRILEFKMDRENVVEELTRQTEGTTARAFKTILRNRTFRGGILASGASLMNVGENGRGVASRWYPETLVRRLKLLAEFRAKVDFSHIDGFDLIGHWSADSAAAFFLDPPYTIGSGAGKRLYRHSELDHERLFRMMSTADAPFMMTYDESPEVMELAERHGFDLERVPMKNTHHDCKCELIIRPS